MSLKGRDRFAVEREARTGGGPYVDAMQVTVSIAVGNDSQDTAGGGGITVPEPQQLN